MFRVLARQVTLPLTPLEASARLARDTEFLLAESLTVDDRRTSVLAIGALWRFESSVAGALKVLTDRLEEMTFEGAPIPSALRSAFGFVSYEAARGFERLPGRHGRIVPDYSFFFPRAVVYAPAGVTDSTLLVFDTEAGDADRWAETILTAPARQAPPPQLDAAALSASFTPEAYGRAVDRAKEYLLDGDIFQVVLSLRWQFPGVMEPLDLYRRLAALNPSPFQYCYRGPGFAAVGASPEPFVTLISGQATVRPLAGTRPRGATPQADALMEQELRSSIKDAAEHRMLVDLARNDLGRICVPGTVEADAVMEVERYSHVMHLVSNVVGKVPEHVRGDEVLRACFPAGTMTGAPKVRAMEIIEELEPVARGNYAGAVGLVSPEEIQTFLVIRSAIQRDLRLSLQAGAGIVVDSDPRAEYAECVSKLAATATALGVMNDLRH